MEGVEIPSYFLCPISLQIMRDPVILSTGITYDRESIERWIFEGKHNVCPMTRQPLPADVDLTPNHNLRRIIQSWCGLNSSASGIERFPTPRVPINRAEIAEILEEAKQLQSQLRSLRKLKKLVGESERNKICVEGTPGMTDFLASIIVGFGSSLAADGDLNDELESTSSACDEALFILHTLQISEEGLLDLIEKNPNIIESFAAILQRSNYQSRACAAMILRSLFGVMAPARLANLGGMIFLEIVNVLRDRISEKATKAALHVVIAMCPWRGNRKKVAEAGAVRVLVELLLEDPHKRECELVLVALSLLCGCAEGRAELVGHAAGVPAVAKKILRVSHLASEMAVRVLHSVASYSATAALLKEMAEVGVVGKLCLVMQADCTAKTKEKAREILRLHAKAWKNSPCLSPQLRRSFPSSPQL